MNGYQSASDGGTPPGMSYPPQATASQKAAAIFRLLDVRKTGHITSEDFRKGLSSRGVVPMLDAAFVMNVANIKEPISLDAFQQWAEIFPIQVHVCHSCMNRIASDEELEAVLQELHEYVTDNTDDEGVFTPPVPTTIGSHYNPVTPPSLQCPQFPTTETPDSMSVRCTSDSALTSPHYQSSSFRVVPVESTGVLNLVSVIIWYSDVATRVKQYRKVLLPKNERSGDLLKISVSIPDITVSMIKKLLLYQQNSGDWISLRSDAVLSEGSQLFLSLYSAKCMHERLKNNLIADSDSETTPAKTTSSAAVWSQAHVKHMRPPEKVSLSCTNRSRDVTVLSSAVNVPPSHFSVVYIFDKSTAVWSVLSSSAVLPNNSDIYIAMLHESNPPMDPPELWYQRNAELTIEGAFGRRTNGNSNSDHRGTPDMTVGKKQRLSLSQTDSINHNKVSILSYIEVLQQQHEYIGELKKEQLKLHQSESPDRQNGNKYSSPSAMICYSQSGGEKGSGKLKYHKTEISYDVSHNCILVTPADGSSSNVSVLLSDVKIFCSYFDHTSQFCSSPAVPGWELVLLESLNIRLIFAMPSEQFSHWQQFLTHSVDGISTTPIEGKR